MEPQLSGAVDLSKHAKDREIIAALAADRDTMRLQRNMLGQALGELLVSIGAMRSHDDEGNPINVNGPTLIGLAHRAISIMQNAAPEFDRIVGRDPDLTTGYMPVHGDETVIDPADIQVLDSTEGGLGTVEINGQPVTVVPMVAEAVPADPFPDPDRPA